VPFSQWVVHYKDVVMQLFKTRDRLVKEATEALEARNQRWAENGSFPRIHARVQGLIGDEEVRRERKRERQRDRERQRERKRKEESQRETERDRET
jgi:hypothetical protein